LNNEAEITIAAPRIIKRRRDALATLAGLLAEASRVYRRMKVGKLDHDKGRSLVWVLAQMRAMVENQHLERIEAKLNQLQSMAESRGLIAGHDSADPQARLPN
jgi:hypothetical protein